MGAMRLGPAARVLGLETLKRALGPANRQRDTLVLQVRNIGRLQYRYRLKVLPRGWASHLAAGSRTWMS